MVEAVVSFVFEKIGDLLVNEGQYLGRVRGQVEDAIAEFQRMRCVLKDADARVRHGDETFCNHVAEIREAAYDLDDVISTFALKVDTQRKRYCIKNVLERHKVVSEIYKISSRISKSRSAFQAYGIRESRDWEVSSTSVNERETRELRGAYSHVVEQDVVGFDDSTKALVTYLTKQENTHQIVSIYGMGGSGKTNSCKTNLPA